MGAYCLDVLQLRSKKSSFLRNLYVFRTPSQGILEISNRGILGSSKHLGCLEFLNKGFLKFHSEGSLEFLNMGSLEFLNEGFLEFLNKGFLEFLKRGFLELIHKGFLSF